MFTIIDADLAHAPFDRVIHVFLGDYVDRGPDSYGTIELLLDRARRHESVFLMGNHELLLLQMLNDPELYQDWKKFGGMETLISYGVRPLVNATASECSALVKEFAHALPDRHRHFFRALKACYSCGDFFFVHAGVRPGIPLDQQRVEDLLWIRDEFLLSEDNFGKYIVHGHSPVRSPDIRSNRINIDTGAYATGNLTLLSIQGDSLLAV
jgi:serine/threonine protein phosphatase 1